MSRSSLDGQWQPPTNVKPRIVCAANRHGELVIPSARHFDDTMRAVINAIYDGDKAQVSASLHMVQGFIDQWGRFYSREDALQVVKDSGQPFNQERNVSKTKLYSEGLY